MSEANRGLPSGRRSRRRVIWAILLLVAAACMFTAMSSGTNIYVHRLLAYLGFEQYERVYQFRTGMTRPVYSPDPSKQVEYVDATKNAGFGIGEGPNETWSMIYNGGGIIGFADGSAVSVSHVHVRGNGSDTTEVSN